MSKIEKVCSDCGSQDVWVNARAEWNWDKQEYELMDTYEDEAYCENCEDSIRIKGTPP
jgi:hypothetical protein